MTGGLTGGIACGKSTAARFFEEDGFGVLDTDAIVHGLLGTNPEVIARVKDRFGASVTDMGNGIDRGRLARIVFADDEALCWLEQLLHPLVGKAWREKVRAEPERPWIVQIPLLFEKKLESSFNFTVCVGADSDVQSRRLQARGLTREDAAGRLARQLPLARKEEMADHYLHNSGSLDFLRAQVKRLAAIILDRFQAGKTPDKFHDT